MQNLASKSSVALMISLYNALPSKVDIENTSSTSTEIVWSVHGPIPFPFKKRKFQGMPIQVEEFP